MVDIIVWLIGILEVCVRNIFGFILYVAGGPMVYDYATYICKWDASIVPYLFHDTIKWKAADTHRIPTSSTIFTAE